MREYNLFKTMKKTAGENNLVVHNREPKVLLDLHLLDDVHFDSVSPNNYFWDVCVEHFKDETFAYESRFTTIFRYNDFDFATIKAEMDRHYVFSKQTGKLLYRILEVTGIEVTYIEHKTRSMHDVGTAHKAFAGSKYHIGDRRDIEI